MSGNKDILEPCPNCESKGGSCLIEDAPSSKNNPYQIVCICGVRGPLSPTFYDAFIGWNELPRLKKGD